MAKVCVMRTDGTNCDNEAKYAFELAGAEADIVHIKTLIKGCDPADADRRARSLDQYDILCLPGGFSHGDYVSAGKIFATDMKHFLGEQIEKFVNYRKPIIGICNGFQTLAKYGLLPKLDGKIKQTATLSYNESGNFECSPVELVKPKGGNEKCIWTKGITRIRLPVAHGEGNFKADEELCDRLFNEGLVVFQYADLNGNPTMDFPDNPNGSMRGIAGICDPTGLIFGLMPHPERYNHPHNHHLASLLKVVGKDYVDMTDPYVRKIAEAHGGDVKVNSKPGIGSTFTINLPY